MKKEIRSFVADELEIREEEGQPAKVSGYAAVFERLSLDMGFREKISRGAFTKSIETRNIKALWNHDTSRPLANTKAGTLKLEENQKGLRFEMELDRESTWGKDAEIAIRRGDCDGVSFGFSVPEGGDTWNNSDPSHPVRTLTEVDLFEVSPCTFPAYPQTSVSVRSAEEVLSDYHSAQAVEDRNASESQEAADAEAKRESQEATLKAELELIEIKHKGVQPK